MPSLSMVMYNGKMVGGNAGIAVFDGSTPSHVVTIGGVTYPTVTIGTQEWLAEDLKCVVSEDTYIWSEQPKYGYYYSSTELHTDINAMLTSAGLSDWHVPTQSEMITMLDYMKTDKGYSTYQPLYKHVFLTSEVSSSDDCYGLGLMLCGSWDGRSSYQYVTDSGLYCNLGEDSGSDSYPNRMYMSKTGSYGNGSEAATRKYCVRLVKSLS